MNTIECNSLCVWADKLKDELMQCCIESLKSNNNVQVRLNYEQNSCDLVFTFSIIGANLLLEVKKSGMKIYADCISTDLYEAEYHSFVEKAIKAISINIINSLWR